MKLSLRIAAAVLVGVACVQASAATPPAIVAKRAQAARVLAEISAIDQQVNTISEQYDGARYKLNQLRAQLKSERVSYLHAKTQYSLAEQRAAKLLVWMYTSSHPSSLDVILGASSLSEVLRLSDDENAISHQAALIAAETDQARNELHDQVVALDANRAAEQTTVAELSSRRDEILHSLAERKHLLASVETQVAHLEAVERARQARLAAEARARLAAEAAARARAAAAEAAQARAAAAAREAVAAKAAKEQAAAALSATTDVPATTTAAATPATTPPDSTTPATTTPAAPATTSPVPDATPTLTPATATPATPLPAGYPQAASLALNYLGVPYVWGGESPSGFDCSGLVAYVYAQLGVALPHYAAAQYTYGVSVPESELEPGDLVFFANLDHVGIYIGDGELIDAPHTGLDVRIESLSDPWYAANYYGARRL